MFNTDWTIPDFTVKECPVCGQFYAVTEEYNECFYCLNRQMGIVIIDHLNILKNKEHGSEE